MTALGHHTPLTLFRRLFFTPAAKFAHNLSPSSRLAIIIHVLSAQPALPGSD